jgi:transcriptional regulator with XRE-family HTH domain
MPKRQADQGGAGAVFAMNLEALMHQARKDGDKHLATPEELEEASGVSRSNIYRYLAQDNYPALDKIERIARAFRLQPWQLLVPGLDPTNPPVVFVTEAERQLYESIRIVGAAARKLEDGGIEKADSSTASPDRHRARTAKTVRGRGRPRKIAKSS